MTDLPAALAELEAESGVGYAQVQRLLCRLVAMGGDSVGMEPAEEWPVVDDPPSAGRHPDDFAGKRQPSRRAQ